VHSQILQNVGDRLAKAFKAFFRRVKNGENPGYPRFKGMHRYNSFCYPQSGFSVEDGRLKLSKIGSVRVTQHRPISGTIKTCTLRKNASGEWDIFLSCEVETQPLPKTEESVGIDVGIESFATFDNGEKIENPRFFKTSEKTLTKAQRKVSKFKKGTPERRRSGKVVSIEPYILWHKNGFQQGKTRMFIRYINECQESSALSSRSPKGDGGSRASF